MTLRYYEVNVPMRNAAGACGVHVFTGEAHSSNAAIRIAHDTYRAAHDAQQTGHRARNERPGGWGACGYRPGWELDWRAATANPWTSEYDLRRVSSVSAT
ncbi:hypothetical protein [Streptomyces sp. NPDC088746]|uniref:hypothetical protein n=1 Tax=Streptomyces sp. NPDC088746 TaxID=3365885 RepID=UPI00382BE02F